jgi:hypothetical protein
MEVSKMLTYPDGTYIGNEEDAYNTFSGAHSRSGRKAKAKCADGRIRTFTVGVSDTYFTCPAHGRINGKYVRGVVTMGNANPLMGPVEYVLFRQHS